jgi:glycerol-3-phosphate dehydrogenase (NAD(P)+)
LWSRDLKDAAAMQSDRISGRHLPGIALPEALTVTGDLPAARISLVTVPAQSVRGLLDQHGAGLQASTLISCAKGIELGTGLGPAEVIRDILPDARAGCLTGPSFAVDIARGLPTALVLAMTDDGRDIQTALTRPALRLYRTDDLIGAQLGGAVKNVIAIAAGMAIGAGYGDSARAAVIARGFAEMCRYAALKGARPETLQGLSGLGDLVLTCTSEKSRNFAAGLGLGRGETPDPAMTVEGIATASALAAEAVSVGIDMPLTLAIDAVVSGKSGVRMAVEALLARPPGKE